MMKYIITESKLQDAIINYLNNMYDVVNIRWEHPMEIDGWNEDLDRLIFYKEDEDYKIIFNWYDKSYWNAERSDYAKRFYEKSPILDFENANDLDSLNGYFGDIWVPVFKKWFQDIFRIPVKSIFNVDV